VSSGPADLNSVDLRGWVDQYQQGDQAAADKLFQAASRRMEHLARKMLRRFPTVARWEQTNDVLQNALVRLLRALAEVRPESTREFFSLAAEQIRRELLDLARRYQGPHGLGRRQAASLNPAPDASAPGVEPIDAGPAADDLELWANLHEAVERLPTVEREVFALVFYHGWKQSEIGDLLGVDERTIRRRWAAAASQLSEALGGELPPI
jgi:RNA polymerase sigma-70 factor (ECF subfamily)